MTLHEAIEILAVTEWVTDPDPECPVSCAVQLGLEALKAIQWYRDYPQAGIIAKLPGETEEE